MYLGVSTKSYVDTTGEDNTLLIKIEKDSGDVVCQRLYGGLGIDGVTNSIDQDEHGYIYLAGKTTSDTAGNDTGVNRAVILKANKECLDSIETVQHEIETPGLRIYPNPTSGLLNIDAGLLEGVNMDLEVFDLSGRVVLQKTNAVGAGLYQFELDLPSGTYLVSISDSERRLDPVRVVIH